MDPIRYVNIASFPTAPEAHLARNELEAAGIPAQVVDEQTVSALWHYGGALGGVKVMIDEKDVPAARKILAELHLAAEPIDEDFDDYGGDDEEDANDEKDDFDNDGSEIANPYRSPRAASQRATVASRADEEADEALTTRIWRSAVIGLVICPPVISCYSLVLLLGNLYLFSRISPKHKWKLWAALCFNLAIIAMMGLFFWTLYLAANSAPESDGGY